MPGTSVTELMAELAELENPKVRAVNEKHDDDHGVNLSKLRAIAKRVKTQQPLARELWTTDGTAARLLALPICKPKEFDGGELDSMLRLSRAPKVQDWLVNYVVRKTPTLRPAGGMDGRCRSDGRPAPPFHWFPVPTICWWIATSPPRKNFCAR